MHASGPAARPVHGSLHPRDGAWHRREAEHGCLAPVPGTWCLAPGGRLEVDRSAELGRAEERVDRARLAPHLGAPDEHRVVAPDGSGKVVELRPVVIPRVRPVLHSVQEHDPGWIA